MNPANRGGKPRSRFEGGKALTAELHRESLWTLIAWTEDAMGRQPNPLLKEFLDPSIPLPDLAWETVPTGVNPEEVWQGYDDCVEGWVPIWFPSFDTLTGRSYGEFERSCLFNDDLERILSAMHRFPPWGSPKQKKHAAAIALLQLYCELAQLSPRVERFR